MQYAIGGERQFSANRPRTGFRCTHSYTMGSGGSETVNRLVATRLGTSDRGAHLRINAGANRTKRRGMNGKRKSASKAKPVVLEAEKGESETDTMTRAMVGPYLRHGVVAKGLADKMTGQLPGDPQLDDYGRAIKAKADLARKGDMGMASEVLTAQALSLDALFTELTRRATMNFGDYPLAAERYARLAFKAQANCRASLEALAKFHQPREQTVRHVHVNEGGQAIVADEFHHHGGTGKNEKFGKQSHATGTARVSAALPSPDPLGNGVPIASREGEAAMQDARGD